MSIASRWSPSLRSPGPGSGTRGHILHILGRAPAQHGGSPGNRGRCCYLGELRRAGCATRTKRNAVLFPGAVCSSTYKRHFPYGGGTFHHLWRRDRMGGNKSVGSWEVDSPGNLIVKMLLLGCQLLLRTLHQAGARARIRRKRTARGCIDLGAATAVGFIAE